MFGFLIFLFVAGGYAFVGGGSYYWMKAKAEERCGKCGKRSYSCGEHAGVAAAGAVGWPIGLPVVFGINVVRNWMKA